MGTTYLIKIFYISHSPWIIQNITQRTKIWVLVQMTLKRQRGDIYDCYVTPRKMSRLTGILIAQLVDARVLKETTKTNSIKTCYCLISRISSKQAIGFERDKSIEHSKIRPDCSRNATALQPQYNGIAACAYSFKNILTVLFFSSTNK